jgi:signal transduction histidine kinase
MLSTPAFGKREACCRLDEENGSDLRELRRLLDEHKEELRRTKGELRKFQPLAMIGRMAQFISHDFRHHLSAVYSDAEFMSDANTAQADRDALLEEVGTTVRTMTDLLDSLLLFAQTGHPLRPHPGSLNVLIAQSVAMVRSHPDARDVEIVVNEMPAIEGWMDCQKLGSAVYNLLLNACQAARRGLSPKRVEIALSQNQNLIHVRVTDTGPGVPDSIRETMFQPFVRADRGSGIGLGLTIAECNAREHGGFVYLAESRPRHTVFVMHLSKLALGECAVRAVSTARKPKRVPSHFQRA